MKNETLFGVLTPIENPYPPVPKVLSINATIGTEFKIDVYHTLTVILPVMFRLLLLP